MNAEIEKNFDRNFLKNLISFSDAKSLESLEIDLFNVAFGLNSDKQIENFRHNLIVTYDKAVKTFAQNLKQSAQ